MTLNCQFNLSPFNYDYSTYLTSLVIGLMSGEGIDWLDKGVTSAFGIVKVAN